MTQDKATIEEVFTAIRSEREYQNSRWNSETTTTENRHSFEEYLVYMEDYMEEAKHVLARETKTVADLKVAHIIRKVVALGVAAMQEHGALVREV